MTTEEITEGVIGRGPVNKAGQQAASGFDYADGTENLNGVVQLSFRLSYTESEQDRPCEITAEPKQRRD